MDEKAEVCFCWAHPSFASICWHVVMDHCLSIILYDNWIRPLLKPLMSEHQTINKQYVHVIYCSLLEQSFFLSQYLIFIVWLLPRRCCLSPMKNRKSYEILVRQMTDVVQAWWNISPSTHFNMSWNNLKNTTGYTIDHEILIQRHKHMHGIDGSALHWFKSYSNNRT